MLDLIYLREKRDELIQSLENRAYDSEIVDRLVRLDERRRALIHQDNELRSERNERSKEVAERKKAGQDASGLIERVKSIGQRMKEIGAEKEGVLRDFEEGMLWLPNIPHESVPVGPDEDHNVVIKEAGKRRDLGFEPKPHWDLGEALGILDFKTSARLSGSRFVFYRGEGARLERALIDFFLDHHRSKGYTEIFPPLLVRREGMTHSAQLPHLEEDAYATQRDELFLIPTSEVSLAALHAGETLSEDDLPRKYVSYTPCFRREAGSHGKDVRGIIRMHQFNKVELFRYAHPERSYGDFEEIVAEVEEVVSLLGLPYRLRLLCTGDMGFQAAKTIDVETWSPGVGRWLEISSISNCEEFQARRSGIRFRGKGGAKGFVHMLNGSALATPRTFISVLENYQREDGSVEVPEVLRPYMGGLEVIE
jgi:seryl-tRNA synthetase